MTLFKLDLRRLREVARLMRFLSENVTERGLEESLSSAMSKTHSEWLRETIALVLRCPDVIASLRGLTPSDCWDGVSKASTPEELVEVFRDIAVEMENTGRLGTVTLASPYYHKEMAYEAERVSAMLENSGLDEFTKSSLLLSIDRMVSIARADAEEAAIQ